MHVPTHLSSSAAPTPFSTECSFHQSGVGSFSHQDSCLDLIVPYRQQASTNASRKHTNPQLFFSDTHPDCAQSVPQRSPKVIKRGSPLRPHRGCIVCSENNPPGSKNTYQHTALLRKQHLETTQPNPAKYMSERCTSAAKVFQKICQRDMFFMTENVFKTCFENCWKNFSNFYEAFMEHI